MGNKQSDSGDTPDVESKCSERVWDSWGAGRLKPCRNKAKVVRDGRRFCGVHDPVAKRERRARRGPTRLERELDLSRRNAECRAACEGIPDPSVVPELVEALRQIASSQGLGIGWARKKACAVLAKLEGS